MNAIWATCLLRGAGFDMRSEVPEGVHTYDDDLSWTGGGHWPAPIGSTDPDAAASWLDARYPPDCRGGLIHGDRALFYGAIGSLAYSIEEPFPTECSLISAVLSRAGAARKASFAAERVMPTAMYGWRRPILLVGSRFTSTARVLVWDQDLATLRLDEDLSNIWLSVVTDPADEDSVDVLAHGLARKYVSLFLAG